MTAEIPQRRKITAAEAAKQLSCSSRTIQRVVEEPRKEFLRRAEQRQREAVKLKDSEGLKYREIADIMGCSERAAQSLVARGRERLKQAGQHVPTPNEQTLPGLIEA